MKSRTAAFLTALVAAAGLAAAPRVALSPGDLSSGHAKLENRCFDCHTPGRGTPRAKCVTCHALDRIGSDAASAEPRVTAIRAMHRSFAAVACGECHTDHAGRGRTLATRRFSHELLSPEVRARCATCHDTRLPTDALHRQTAAECGSCHTTTAWKPATFAHDRYFVLDRDHGVECRTCHDQPTDYRRYTCYGCHEHTPARMRAEHREEGVRELDQCVRCHRSADDDEGRGNGESRERGRGAGDDRD